jgi:zinc finger protein DZIP1
LLIEEELRVITENPYEYQDDDEQCFQAMMPYEMRSRPGVRSVEYHDSTEVCV